MLRDDVQPVSVDDHVIEPAARVRRPHRAAVPRPRAAHRRPRRCRGLALGGPLLPAELPGQRPDAEVPSRRGGARRRPLRPPLRGHDPGRVRRARTHPGDGRRRRVGRAAVPDVPALRRHAVPRRRGQGPGGSRWCAPGTTGCSTSGAPRTPTGSSRRRSSRCGTCPARSPRSSAAPARARGRCCSSRTRTRWGCRRSRPGTGDRCSRRATRPASRCRCTSARRWDCSSARRPRRRRRSASRCAVSTR